MPFLGWKGLKPYTHMFPKNTLTTAQYVPVSDVELRPLGSATLFEPTRSNMGHKMVNPRIRALQD